jgi:hypothetical protein
MVYSAVRCSSQHWRDILNGHMQIGRRDADVRVACRVPNLGQRPSTSQRVRNERVPAVVDRQRLQPLRPEHPARRPVALA